MALDMQSIYILAAGGSRAMEQLDVTANNIANVNNDGFKRLVVKEMSERLNENPKDGNHLFVFPRFKESVVDLAQGELQSTQNPTDFALHGEGFFLVQKGDQTLLTRNSHYHLNQDGFLVDSNGNFLLSDQEQPIQLDPTVSFEVSKEGIIYQNGQEIAKLGVRNYTKVKPLGESYYQPSSAPAPTNNYQILQGYAEESNVNPILEMTKMIEAQRRFELYSNNIKSLDELNQKTNEIGKA